MVTASIRFPAPTNETDMSMVTPEHNVHWYSYSSPICDSLINLACRFPGSVLLGVKESIISIKLKTILNPDLESTTIIFVNSLCPFRGKIAGLGASSPKVPWHKKGKRLSQAIMPSTVAANYNPTISATVLSKICSWSANYSRKRLPL